MHHSEQTISERTPLSFWQFNRSRWAAFSTFSPATSLPLSVKGKPTSNKNGNLTVLFVIFVPTATRPQNTSHISGTATVPNGSPSLQPIPTTTMSAQLRAPLNVRRRHSLNPESLRISPLVTNSSGSSPTARAVLTRNRRSFVFSSSGIVSGSSAGNAVGHPLNGTPIVAIDSKIEQAMDLVKTHLMFAVREEVEHLRSRIMELETTVVHLEAENSILREHVPTNVIQSLSLQTNSTQSGTTTMT